MLIYLKYISFNQNNNIKHFLIKLVKILPVLVVKQTVVTQSPPKPIAITTLWTLFCKVMFFKIVLYFYKMIKQTIEGLNE